MNMKLLQSAIRILIAVAGLLLLIIGPAILAVRQPTFSKIPFSLGPRADAGRLQKHVEYLAGELAPRNHKHPEKLNATVQYLLEGLAVPGAKIFRQPYFIKTDTSEKIEQVNIIARFGSNTASAIIVGAHYDVAGSLPGADDNSSGVAGLLELARLLSLRKTTADIELVAFATEEAPFFGTEQMGSAFHARTLSEQNQKIKAMICLEMIGYFVEKQQYSSWALRLAYPGNGLYAAIVGRWQDRQLAKTVKRSFQGASDLQALSYSGPPLFGADYSDHRNYWEQGYPAVMITDTAFIRNPNYHTANDTPETLDYRRMAEVVDGVLNSVLHLSQE